MEVEEEVEEEVVENEKGGVEEVRGIYFFSLSRRLQ